MAKRARLEVPPRQALTRLAEDQGPRRARSSWSPATRAARGGARARSARSCSATYEGGELVYVGNVGTGLQRPRDRPAPEEAEAARARRRRRSQSVPKMPRVRKGDVVWVEPKLVAEVEFVEWTHDGHLRAPVLPGPARGQGRRPRCTARSRSRSATEIRKGKRVLKLVEPRQAVLARRGDHEGRPALVLPRVAPVLLPHLKDRPFTMKRYPDGWQGKFFFQKDAPKGMPDWIPTASIVVSTRDKPRQRRRIDAPLVNDELALLWMVNMGCIDLNTWYSRIDKPERPDFVLFDLDPSPDVGFPETIAGRAARQAGARRARAGELRRRRAAPRASTSSSRSRAGTRTRTRASSRRSSPARSRARTAGSSRPSGRRRSAAAC